VTFAAESRYENWSLEGEYEPVSLGSPAAGAALVYTVPGTVQQEVMSACFTFTASANAANRIPFLELLDQSGIPVASASPGFTYVATNAVICSFGVGLTSYGANASARAGAGIPLVRLRAGMQVKFSAVLIDVADTITKGRLFVRQWRTDDGEA
jgi:hypothetical protein